MEWVVASLIFAQVVDSNLYCVVVVEELLKERVEGYLLQLLRQRLFGENTILARLTLTRYLDWLIVRLFHMVHGSRCFWALIHSFWESHVHLDISSFVVKVINMVKMVLLAFRALCDRHLGEFSQFANKTQVVMFFWIKMHSLHRRWLANDLDSWLNFLFCLVGSVVRLNFIAFWVLFPIIVIHMVEQISAFRVKEWHLFENEKVSLHVFLVQKWSGPI